MSASDKLCKALEEIRVRLDTATPGPWKAYDWPEFPRRDEYKSCVRIESKTTITAFCFEGQPNHDALLIAHAPTDLRQLLTAVEKLDKALMDARFDLQMTHETGGFNHCAIPNIDRARAEVAVLFEGGEGD